MSAMMKTQAIIPTAGIGTRFGAEIHKPLAGMDGRPIIGYTLSVFEDCPSIDSVILVGHADHIDELKALVAGSGLSKVTQIVAGGKTRRESVFAGLKNTDEDTGIVLIHDGVRPLVSRDLIEKSVEACQRSEAVIAAVPVKPTIKKVDPKSMTVEETLDRSGLWEVQTPQVFRKDVLMKAHGDFQGDNPTDDAMMVEDLGIEVRVVQGEYTNIKVTTPEDLVMAEAFLGHRKTGKVST